MDASYFSLMDMAIVGVPAIVIGVWQLVSVNREIAKDKAKAKAKADEERPDTSSSPARGGGSAQR